MGYVIPVSEMIKTNSERLSDLPSVTQLINNIKKMNPSLSVSRVYLLNHMVTAFKIKEVLIC